ncbi:MAG: carbohydrate ABC transporter permease [Chloroflexi bacterium]|nr:carbohydrate ABC transporter permease [Chloroflexota bacterium]
MIRAVRALPIASARRTTIVSNAFIYTLLLLGTAFSIGPFLWTVSGSLMTDIEVQAYPPKLFPAKPQWHNYVQVWQEVPFGRWLMNSSVVVVLAVLGTTLSASLVAYSFARMRYPGRDLLFMVTLSTMMLPVEVTLIPTYLLFRELRWLDTLKPLIVPSFFGGGAFNIFLMRQFLLAIPRELDEAAIVDGANSWRIFWQILMPLCKPALATLAVIGFIGHWNNFMGPLIFINTVEKFTVAVGVRFFQLGSIPGILTKDHLLLAASVMVTAPCLVLFFMAQKYFVQGIVMTGIKG